MGILHNSYVSVISASHGKRNVIVVFRLEVIMAPTFRNYSL